MTSCRHMLEETDLRLDFTDVHAQRDIPDALGSAVRTRARHVVGL
jgi:hypothetical protein